MQDKLSQIGDKNTVPVVALIKDGKVLMGMRDYDSATWKKISVWTCPGGKCEEGKTIEQALRREIVEETGITIFSIDKYLGQIRGASDDYVVELFIGKTEQEPEMREPEKFSKWEWQDTRVGPDSFINPPVLDLIRSHIYAS